MMFWHRYVGIFDGDLYIYMKLYIYIGIKSDEGMLIRL